MWEMNALVRFVMWISMIFEDKKKMIDFKKIKNPLISTHRSKFHSSSVRVMSDLAGQL